MITTTLILGTVLGVLLASMLGVFQRPTGAPAQIVTVNPVPAAAGGPGCLARLGALVKGTAIIFLILFFLRLALLS